MSVVLHRFKAVLTHNSFLDADEEPDL